MGVDLGNLIGPTLAGTITERVQATTGSTVAGYSTMYRCMIIPIAIGVIIFLINRKNLLQLSSVKNK